MHYNFYHASPTQAPVNQPSSNIAGEQMLLCIIIITVFFVKTSERSCTNVQTGGKFCFGGIFEIGQL